MIDEAKRALREEMDSRGLHNDVQRTALAAIIGGGTPSSGCWRGSTETLTGSATLRQRRNSVQRAAVAV